MALEEDFTSAQERVKSLSKTPNNETLLQLYSLFKQATVGDVAGSRPGALSFKARAKYDAWAGVKGMNGDAAKQSYVELVNTLLARDK